MNDRNRLILIKYGGNAMTNTIIRDQVIDEIVRLKSHGFLPVIVHGGGPFIKRLLDMAGIKSEFLDGHRLTTAQGMPYVEMALKGQVNGELVNLFIKKGMHAVGLSGKDARMVTARRKSTADGKDFGQVGNVINVNSKVLLNLLNDDFTPVIAPIAIGNDFLDYNINADVFAGHIAASLQVEHFILLTDVDGLYRDKSNPETLLSQLSITEAQEIQDQLEGGMLPKVEAAITALKANVQNCVFLNGNSPDNIERYFNGEMIGTRFTMDTH